MSRWRLCILLVRPHLHKIEWEELTYQTDPIIHLNTGQNANINEAA
ncbi:hypothetical protein P4H57_01210 [Paenibacillus pabuli]|nr:hypothetical protein [Paenibacillus pabuli]MEC0123177.1 hypothetical protein [Paenibacillus pabuli]